ncbi:MAG: glycosyltransferase family 2 protein [Proteobacteria bacterium]|nr:glycosyltransferase family 2 protein [Pseudomonadota bacterium]
MTQSLFIVIPAFNEGGVIATAVKDALSQTPTVIVVDDGSVDNTALAAHSSGAWVLRHPVNLGQGAALQTGIDFAIQQGASHVATFDADGQHDARDIQLMIEQMAHRGVDVILGSRFLGSSINMSTHRRWLLMCATLFTRITTGLRLTDTHNGLRLFSREAATKIRICQNRMAHASEILSEIARLGISYAEAPVTIRYTEYSRTKGQQSARGSLRIIKDLLIGALSR